MGIFPHPRRTRQARQGRRNRPDYNQHACNVCIHFNELETKPKYLIHNRDGKFVPFDAIIEPADIEPKRPPPHSPNCNAIAERWARSFRDECLNHYVIFGERHMQHLVQSYVDFYNAKRPHQSSRLKFGYRDVPARN